MNISSFVGVCALLLWQLVCGSGACNVTLYAEREPLNFTSPNYPNNYRNNESCYWDIYPRTSGYSVVIDMVYSNIQRSYTCVLDDLAIYRINNAYQTFSRLRRVCGSSRWTLRVDGDHHFHLLFTTDASVRERGFLIRYYETKGSAYCGVPLVATSVGKTFTSPGYPNSYYPHLSCSWNITTEHPNQTVMLYTNDSDLEDDCSRNVCDEDYVTVYNEQNSSDILGSFCGDQQPVFISGGNSLRVHLRTDASDNSRGFKMLYKAVPATTCNVTMPAGKSPIQIVSPGYPDNYKSDLDCQWVINAPHGRIISVEVLFAEMEISPTCGNDYLLFNDGSSTFAGRAKICNATSTPIVSSSNHMTILFHSDSAVAGKGFRLQYSAVHPCYTCPSYLTASLYTEKYLTSPGYPATIPNKLPCTWTISATFGYRIKVEIVALSIGTSCISDYLLFRDGPSSYNAQLGKYCGSTNAVFVVSSGNRMTITFQTEGPSRGFQLKYTAEHVTTSTEAPNARNCSSSWLSASALMWTHLTSPGYPNKYANNLHCRWTIFAPIGRKVVVEIVDLSIELADSCAADYLLISDGSSSYSAQLGKYCGYSLGSVFSSSNYITVTFNTDSSVNRKGFTLKYKSTAPGCGQDIQLDASETKYVESPNYPYAFPANAECAWTISSGVAGSSIHLEVVHFDLPYDVRCSNDYVIIHEGTSQYLLGQWYGSNGPDTPIFASSLKVRFHADGTRSSSGFKLAVTTVHPTSEPAYKDNIGAIIGGVFAAIVFLVIVGCCCCGVCSMKKSTPSDQRRDRSSDNSVYSIPLSNPQRTAAFSPPPAYSEVVKNDPPPYCQVAQLSDIQPIVASSPSGASGIDNPAAVE